MLKTTAGTKRAWSAPPLVEAPGHQNKRHAADVLGSVDCATFCSFAVPTVPMQEWCVEPQYVPAPSSDAHMDVHMVPATMPTCRVVGDYDECCWEPQ